MTTLPEQKQKYALNGLLKLLLTALLIAVVCRIAMNPYDMLIRQRYVI